MALVPVRLVVPWTRDCPLCARNSLYVWPAAGRAAQGVRLVVCVTSASQAAPPPVPRHWDQEHEEQVEEGEDYDAPAPKWRNGSRPWSLTSKQNPPPWMARGSTAPAGPSCGKVNQELTASSTESFDNNQDFMLPAAKTTAMSRIVQKLQSVSGCKPVLEKKSYLGYSQQQRRVQASHSVFMQRPENNGQVVPRINPKWSSPDHPMPVPGFQDPGARAAGFDTRFPWEMQQGEEQFAESPVPEKQKRVRPPSLAELTIPGEELKRLRGLGLHMRHRLKIGRLGVTDGVVDFIHDGWRTSEIVKIKCEGPPALNMKKTHEDLERKTGGLVIWRSGSASIIYRGKDYVHPSKLPQSVLEMRRQPPPPLFTQLRPTQKPNMEAKLQQEQYTEQGQEEDQTPSGKAVVHTLDFAQYALVSPTEAVFQDYPPRDEADGNNSDSSLNAMKDALLSELVGTRAAVSPRLALSDMMERELEEVEMILKDLGPRYLGWTGQRPIPVDGDLLLANESAYKKPYRLLPYGVRASLSNCELTDLRRLARPLPPHFVLGRNKGLGGLAAAILKLWEKSEIAKVAVKRGVQNTNNERMAEELKRYTGGVLLSRNKEYIVLYRGKDFLPPLVAAALEEREALTKALQEEEETLRFRGRSSKASAVCLPLEKTGTLVETLHAKEQWEAWNNSEEARKNRDAARSAARRSEVDQIERKMELALAKKKKAEDALMKVEKSLELSGPPADAEYLTDEERYMFKKVGLKMKAFLLIGRRGVFDGVVENMHLHWKHRELVKIILKEDDPRELQYTAKMLAYESGGLLVATVKVSKGQAIIVYRGKNYQRPLHIRPRHLLTKRQALKRSIELQRRKALERHILGLEKQIQTMTAGLEKYVAEADQDPAQCNQVISNAAEADLALLGGLGVEKKTAGVSCQQDTKTECPNIVYRAEPLSTKERLVLRRHALKVMGKAANFNVGKSNVLTGLAAAVRDRFKRNALVKIGVKGRAGGTSLQELVQELEELTGGVLVCLEQNKVILFRGWADGQPKPDVEDVEELSPQLMEALKIEDASDDGDMDERFVRVCCSLTGGGEDADLLFDMKDSDLDYEKEDLVDFQSNDADSTDANEESTYDDGLADYDR